MPNNEFGDFQTPTPLAAQCLRILGIPEHARLLEPTCGLGSFLEAAAAMAPQSERIGLEIQESYAAEASQWGNVRVANIFETQLSTDLEWETSGHLFVVGNPPWVTSAELNRMDSKNLPPKENFKGAKGLDAMLGSSNFDVCEYIILKVLKELRGERFTLGMLCKTQVARNVIQYAASIGIPIAGSELYRIDAKKWFNAGVDACWFVVAVDPGFPPDYTTLIHDDLFAPGAQPVGRFGVVDGLFVSDVDRYKQVRIADGKCPYEWRSGLKHDASSVFELKASPAPTTKDGNVLNIEKGYVFPLLKSTDIFRGRHHALTKWVIVPQKTFGADTEQLVSVAPNLWEYLLSKADLLDGRKSSIYRNRPRFSVFGHGDYTFAPYKVAVSGLHKSPVFQLVAPIEDLPVVLDDTCYFLSFKDPTEASVVTALLSTEACTDLIESMVFWDSKRPITKKLLSRLDITKLPVIAEQVLDSAKRIASEADLPFDEQHAYDYMQHFKAPVGSALV